METLFVIFVFVCVFVVSIFIVLLSLAHSYLIVDYRVNGDNLESVLFQFIVTRKLPLASIVKVARYTDPKQEPSINYFTLRRNINRFTPTLWIFVKSINSEYVIWISPAHLNSFVAEMLDRNPRIKFEDL